LWKRTDSWILLTEDVFMAELCSVGGAAWFKSRLQELDFQISREARERPRSSGRVCEQLGINYVYTCEYLCACLFLLLLCEPQWGKRVVIPSFGTSYPGYIVANRVDCLFLCNVLNFNYCVEIWIIFFKRLNNNWDARNER
jgi:hypothetical protein